MHVSLSFLLFFRDKIGGGETDLRMIHDVIQSFSKCLISYSFYFFIFYD